MFASLMNKITGGVDGLKAAAQKYADRETAEAVVAIATGVAHADGELEEAERAKITAIFKTHPLLTQFDSAVLMEKFGQLLPQFALDTEIGLDACLKELKDVGSKAPAEKRILIMRLGVATARADGEIEPAEKQFLARCGAILGVQLSDVGL